MGLEFYLARPDNHTLFHMGTAYYLNEIIGGSSDTTPVDFRVLYLGLSEWYDGDQPEMVAAIMAAIQEFAQSQPIYFISEHYPWLDTDEDDYYDGDKLRVVGSIWDVDKDES
jgi:hypothetical protein